MEEDNNKIIPVSPVDADNKEWNEIVNSIVDELNETDLPDKVIQATEFLLAGYPVYKAAKKVGTTPATIRRWMSMYPTMAFVVSNGRKLLSKWRMAKLEQQFVSAIERSQEVLDISLDGTTNDNARVDPKVLTVVAAQARYIIGLFAGQKVDVTVTHELGDTVMKGKTDALDYIAKALAEQQVNAANEPIEAVYKIVDVKKDDQGPMLDETGNSPFGKIGEYDSNEGGTICHACGKRLKSLGKHVLTQHGMETEEYETLYLLQEGSLKSLG